MDDLRFLAGRTDRKLPSVDRTDKETVEWLYGENIVCLNVR